MTLKSDNYNKQPWLNTLMGSKIRIRTPGARTDNLLTVIEYVEPSNTSPPVFTRHEFLEVFCVTKGTLNFQFLGEDQFLLTSGESVTCESFKPHSFWNNTTEPVTVLLICTPAGLDQFFIESDELLKQFSDTTKNESAYFSAMKTLRSKHGLEHVGKPPTCSPNL